MNTENDRFEKYFENMPCYLSVQDRDLRILDANQQFQKDFGALEGRTCYQAYKQRSEACEDCPVLRSFRDGKRHSSEQRVITEGGREITVLVFTTPIRNDEGEVTSVMEMGADITEIKELQTNLRESQRRYRALFEEVPCYISIQDPELNIIEANRSFRDDFGSVMGKKCYRTYKHRDEVCVPCSVKETFEDGKIHHREEVVTSIHGQQKNVVVFSAPLENSKGEITSVMEMSTDITPIRKLQSQLEGIGLLISSISHGIKGLLTGLDGGMYLVNSGLSKNNQGRVEQGWEMVQRNIDRIRSSVLNILYYAKEREPIHEEVDACALAQEAFSLVKARAEEVGLDYVLNLPEDSYTAEMDPKAIRSLLVNLLENSVDACRVDKKKSEHKVSFGLRNSKDYIMFDVADNGIGMDQETREKAFSLFFSSKGVEGTGLGLFIAHKIAKAHNGTIVLDSELEKGTRFVVKIPKYKTIDPPSKSTI